TINILSTGASNSYTTASATTFGGGLRIDGTIGATSNTVRGYAVFNLSSIPAGAIITSCVIGFDVTTYGGTTPSGWVTYGYAGNLSTVTVAATLFADMVTGTVLSNASYGTAVGNQ